MVNAYRRLTFKLLFELILITLHQEQKEIKESILSLIELEILMEILSLIYTGLGFDHRRNHNGSRKTGLITKGYETSVDTE